MTIISHKQGIPLSSIDEIPDEIVSKLAKLSIATCEEFISIIPNDMANYAKSLNIAKDKLSNLYDIIKKYTPDVESENIVSKDKEEEFAYGAHSPHSKEFDEYLKKEARD
jgi:hypothetical protein